MISIQNLSKKFVSGNSSVNALTDINLEIKEGEFIALVGPSGSGKSTLLNLIGGLDIASEGEVIVRKQNLNQLSDSELSNYRNLTIGFVFQEFHLEPFLTVKENILLPTFFNHFNEKDEAYAEKLIEEVQLPGKSSNKINELSGGQKQRTAIARALINKPKILLADEPTGDLDSKTGQTIIELLKKLHKEHKTTLVIATHDENIAKVADKIIHIKDGKTAKLSG